ncbi:protein asteroid-like [Colletes gigas]|uniref:protein asteroid-like n=1 Tax=Colletes gigas TaxID=935657 RepID=UPI001C9A4FC5|nr:protein asteroid-like [Colletes gigas]
MGIFGLTSYTNKNYDWYFKYFELHDTYLVIDGNSTCCQLYEHANCNSDYGGDYDEYAECTSDFFNALLKCNVTPLVILDGGYSDMKLERILKRCKEKNYMACNFIPYKQQVLLPLMIVTVFRDIMKKLNIRFVQCLFDADNSTAAVAKALNCPVLSYDSDFYLYGIEYIRFDTLSDCIVRDPITKNYRMPCKIYRIEHLLNAFEGLNQCMLPLAAVLLGNDITDHNLFKNFFNLFKLPHIHTKFEYRQLLIGVTFNWLSKHTLEEAITEILNTISEPMRQEVLNIIEVNINNYTNPSAEMLVPLGFPEKYNIQGLNDSANKNLEKIEKGKENVDEIMNECKKLKSVIETAIDNLPTWFLDEFYTGKYTGYFIHLSIFKLFVYPIQIDNFLNPSSAAISLPILRVIFGLLNFETNNSETATMKYMMRNQNNELAWHEVEGINTIPLSNLKKITSIARTEILNNTLGITNMECLNELLPEWRLYIACMKYWKEQQIPSKSHKHFIYAMLFCIFSSIINLKIGKIRSLRNFQMIYSEVIQAIKKKRERNDPSESHEFEYKQCDLKNTMIIDAYNNIKLSDCLLAAPFFISHFQISRYSYNRNIIHAFAEFQICLKSIMDLNMLLDYPYLQPKVANLFNSTLLYNLYNNFQTRNNIKEYINTVLQNSPSLLMLFDIILLKIEPLLGLDN